MEINIGIRKKATSDKSKKYFDKINNEIINFIHLTKNITDTKLAFEILDELIKEKYKIYNPDVLEISIMFHISDDQIVQRQYFFTSAGMIIKHFNNIN